MCERKEGEIEGWARERKRGRDDKMRREKRLFFFSPTVNDRMTKRDDGDEV